MAPRARVVRKKQSNPWDEWQKMEQEIKELRSKLGDAVTRQRELKRHMIEALTIRTDRTDVKITNRQLQVIELIRDHNGRLANKEIANLLNISERTVKFHISALLIAYQVQTRQELYLCCKTENRGMPEC